MTWSFAVFFVLMLAVLGAVNLRAYRAATNAFAFPPWAKRVLSGVLIASLGGMSLGRLLDRFAPGTASWVILFTASIVQLAVLISVVPLLVVDLGALAARVARRFLTRRAEPAVPPLIDAPAGATALPSPVVVPRRAVLAQIATGSASSSS